MVSLYSLGFRENTQSREDVAGSALADAVLGPFIMACGDKDLAWSKFNALKTTPARGWADYLNESTGMVKNDITSVAKSALDELNRVGYPVSTVLGTLNGATGASGMDFGVVLIREKDSPIAKLAFRATAKTSLLLAMPIYYTEVRFQGDPNK